MTLQNDKEKELWCRVYAACAMRGENDAAAHVADTAVEEYRKRVAMRWGGR